MSKPLKIFITYSHKNTEAKDELITWLAVLKSEGLISIWHDNEILPGDKWRDTIFDNLTDSDILLYLTSVHSLASENCNKELASALNAEIRVIPIILDHCDWENHQLSDFQALPDKGNPINEWQPESKGWQSIVEGIRKVIKEMQSQADSSSAIPEKELRAKLAFQQGNVLMMIGQIDRAIKAYSDAIELKPDYAEAYNNRGGIYGKKGEFDCAIEDCNRAIQIRPDYAEAYNNRGNAYSKKGEYGHAITDYNRAIHFKPDCAEAYNNRGNVYVKKGESDLAIKDCSMAIQLKSNYAEAYYNRGTAYGKKNEYDLAIKNFNTAIEIKSDYANTFAKL